MDMLESLTRRLDHHLDLTVPLLYRAGKILVEEYAREQAVRQKADGTPVTNVDVKLSRSITAELQRTFPTYGILDEEQNGDGRSEEFCWILDPLDGTTEYLSKSGQGYGIILGLLHEQKPVMGLLYQPQFDTLTYALRGQGAYQVHEGTKKMLEVSCDTYLHVLISKYRHSPELEQLLHKLDPVRVTRSSGAIKIVEIARATATAFVTVNPMGLWDLCGTSLILEEAGGKITDLQGHALDFYQPERKVEQGIIASTARLHPLILERLYDG